MKAAELEAALMPVFTERGYLPEEVHVDLFVMDEYNQILIICDHKNQRHVNVNIESNALEWTPEQMADAVATAIDDANMEERGYA